MLTIYCGFTLEQLSRRNLVGATFDDGPLADIQRGIDTLRQAAASKLDPDLSGASDRELALRVAGWIVEQGRATGKNTARISIGEAAELLSASAKKTDLNLEAGGVSLALERWMQCVEDFLACWARSYGIREAFRLGIRPSIAPEAAADLEQIGWESGVLRGQIQSNGRTLAKALTARGEDTGAIYDVLHCLEWNGGTQAVNPIWDEARPKLQKLVDRLKSPPPLSPNAAIVYRMLIALPSPEGAMTGPEILDALSERGKAIDQSTLTKRIVPELEPYGIENFPRIGYRIHPSRHPGI